MSLTRTGASAEATVRRLLPAVLVVATCVAFFPSLQNDFVNWDDDYLLLKNLEYRGLGLAHLRWMATTTLMGHWAPLTWATHGLDYVLWGMNPFGYHLTNVLLHAATVLAFFYLALRLLRLAQGSAGEGALQAGAATAALFFAIHPLRVESVAWITERRDVLSGLWFVLAIIAYLKAAGSQEARRKWLAIALGCYGLAVLSKSIVMTLPAVLLILDVYPLRRIGNWRTWLSPEARRVWIEKIPFVALAAVAGGMALVSQRTVMLEVGEHAIATRIGTALYGIWYYVWRMLTPYPISPLYELDPNLGTLSARFVGSALALAAISIALVGARRHWPAGLATWVAYLVLVAPVSGLTQAGPQLVATRYTYLSHLGFALLLGAAAVMLADRERWPQWRHVPTRVAAVAAVALFGALGALTWAQCRVWHDSGTLWTHALTINPRSLIAHNNLALHYIEQGQFAEAERHLRIALDLQPGFQNAVKSLGALALRGQLEEAARTDIGMRLVQQGDFDEAAELFAREIKAKPTDATAYNNLGVAYYAKGDYPAAIKQFERALQLDPNFDEARKNLGAVRMKY